jgi:hypothetical protein
MSNKYLDLAGVEKLWGAVKSEDADVLASAKGLINGLHLEYDSIAKTITLKGSTHADVTIPTSDFVKDGILEEVVVVTSSPDAPIEGYTDGTKFLRFTWNTDSGKTEDYLNVNDFAKAYIGSDSISINDANEISVVKVDADKAKTTDAIPVAGGPLASLLNGAGITEIAPGTNMQDLLMSLFCKVEYPGDGTIAGTTGTNGTMKVTLAEPSFTLSNSGTTVEIGTVCTLSKVTIPSAAVPEVKAYPKVTGFKYGYSAADDNTRDSASTEIVGTLAEGVSPSLTSDNYTMKIDYTNFIYAADSTVGTAGTAAADVKDIANSDYSAVKYDGDKLAVVNGTNSVKVDITGPKAVGSFAAIEPHYACSNTKKTRSGENAGEGVYHVSTKLAAASDVKSNASSNTKTLSVTGAYKYFIGYYRDLPFDEKTYTSTSIRNNAENGGDCVNSGFVNGTSINYTITVPAGTKGMYIAIPEGIDDSGKNLTVTQTTALNSPVGKDMVANLRTLTNMACAGTATKNYKVFTWSFPDGTEGEETFAISKF